MVLFVLQKVAEDLVRGHGERGAALAVAAARHARADHLRAADRAVAARRHLREVAMPRIESVEILQVDLAAEGGADRRDPGLRHAGDADRAHHRCDDGARAPATATPSAPAARR